MYSPASALQLVQALYRLLTTSRSNVSQDHARVALRSIQSVQRNPRVLRVVQLISMLIPKTSASLAISCARNAMGPMRINAQSALRLVYKNMLFFVEINCFSYLTFPHSNSSDPLASCDHNMRADLLNRIQLPLYYEHMRGLLDFLQGLRVLARATRRKLS